MRQVNPGIGEVHSASLFPVVQVEPQCFIIPYFREIPAKSGLKINGPELPAMLKR
jgi:hypothetical protein